MRRLVLPLLLGVAACGPLPPRPEALTLPTSAMPQGIGDPTRGAILSSAYVFGAPATVAGNPAGAAEALAQLEFLAVQLVTDQRWIGLNPTTQILLAQGRAEARAAFGIAPTVPPQQAVDQLYAAMAAFREGNRDRAAAALAPLTGEAGVPAAMAKLDAMPYLPVAAAATAQARIGMAQLDMDRRGGLTLPR